MVVAGDRIAAAADAAGQQSGEEVAAPVGGVEAVPVLRVLDEILMGALASLDCLARVCCRAIGHDRGSERRAAVRYEESLVLCSIARPVRRESRIAFGGALEASDTIGVGAPRHRGRIDSLAPLRPKIFALREGVSGL